MEKNDNNKLNSANGEIDVRENIRSNTIKRRIEMYLTAADLLIYCFWILAAISLFFCQKYFFGSSADTVIIHAEETVYTYPLSVNRQILLQSKGFSLTVDISDGCVSVRDSSCPDHLCETAGKIRNAGESIICLPAEISVSLSSTSKGDAPQADDIAG